MLFDLLRKDLDPPAAGMSWVLPGQLRLLKLKPLQRTGCLDEVMTPTQLSKLWTFVCLASLLFALNSWLATQGGAEIFDAKLLTTGRVPVALTAIPVVSVLLAVLAAIGIAYARRGSAPWHARIPIVGFESIDTGSAEGRWFQAATMVGLTLVPLAALVHFWLVIDGALVVTTGTGPRLLSGIWDWSGLTSLNDPARACTALQPGAVACSGGVTVLPGLQPAAYGLISLGSLVLVLRHWLAVLRG